LRVIAFDRRGRRDVHVVVIVGLKYGVRCPGGRVAALEREVQIHRPAGCEPPYRDIDGLIDTDLLRGQHDAG
jgi:hypothetical protein